MSTPSAAESPTRVCWSCRNPLSREPFCPICRIIQPADPNIDFFRLFDLEPSFDLSTETIEPLYRTWQQRFHPDRYASRTATERRYSLERVTRLNEAYRTLKDPLLRAEYLLSLSGRAKSEGAASDPVFLMEVMELREALEELDLKRADAGDRLEESRDEAQRRIDRENTGLADCFSNYFSSRDESHLEQAARLVERLRYYHRFLEEIERLEERLFEETDF